MEIDDSGTWLYYLEWYCWWPFEQFCNQNKQTSCQPKSLQHLSRQVCSQLQERNKCIYRWKKHENKKKNR